MERINLGVLLRTKFQGMEQGIQWHAFQLPLVQSCINQATAKTPTTMRIPLLRKAVWRINSAITAVDCWRKDYTLAEQAVLDYYLELIEGFRKELLAELVKLDPSEAPRSWTQEELTQAFITEVKVIAAEAVLNHPHNAVEAAEQTAFSILSLLDCGWITDVDRETFQVNHWPGFRLVAVTNAEDIEYSKKYGQNYTDPDLELDSSLHERFYQE